MVVDVLTGAPGASRLRGRLFTATASLHAPHLLDLEVLHVLRRFERRGMLDRARASEVVEDLLDLPLTRYPPDPFASRIWELRGALTAYDAAYVALAEALGAPLLTRDAALGATRGHRARVEVV